MSNAAIKVTKIRAGLYRATTANKTFLIEDRWDDEATSAYPWRLSDEDAFHDPWRGDFATKREALAEIPLVINEA